MKPLCEEWSKKYFNTCSDAKPHNSLVAFVSLTCIAVAVKMCIKFPHQQTYNKTRNARIGTAPSLQRRVTADPKDKQFMSKWDGPFAARERRRNLIKSQNRKYLLVKPKWCHDLMLKIKAVKCILHDT
jgi:hypothetical protein